MSTTSPMMDLSGSIAVEENFQTCDSPSGSSTSEPHDETVNLQQPSFIDQSFFYKLDQLSPDNPLFFMQQQQQQQNNNTQQHQHNNIQQLQQQQIQHSISPSLSPQPSVHSPPSQSSMSHSNFADPLLPNSSNANESNPTFWSGFNNVSHQLNPFYFFLLI